jgi:hypothetical protein
MFIEVLNQLRSARTQPIARGSFYKRRQDQKAIANVLSKLC